MQYEVIETIHAGCRAFYTRDSGGRAYIEQCTFPTEPCPSAHRAYALETFYKGDYVEISLGCAVKVRPATGTAASAAASAATTITTAGTSPVNIKYDYNTQAWFIADTIPSSDTNVSSQNQKQECRCPFVNLGIIHVANCSLYKSETKEF